MEEEGDWVFIDGDPQKFFEMMIETLHDKLVQIQDRIQDYSADDRSTCEQWVILLNVPCIVKDDNIGFIQSTHLREKTENVFDLLESLRSSIEKYKAIDKSKVEQEAICNEINKNEKLQFRLEQLDRQIEQLKKEDKRLTEKVTLLEQQKEGLLTRLSQVAGLKVYDNNPSIQDLSDTKRPMKLAEAFGELYDNEWTNALEELLKQNVSERQAIDQLRNILKNVFETCQSSAMDQRRNFIKDASFCGNDSDDNGRAIPQSLRKAIKSFQKENAMEIYQFVKKRIDQQLGIDNLGDELKHYVHRCSELCWLMNIQDPPLVLHFNAAAGEPFDKMLFSHYTRSGTVVDYVVWPAVMYENGTVYRKGVLQPT
ncbi:uncharacterized protein LOC134248061 isoform X1 [Saccostrea cucullata]|uniref:uncharacterized protein LOC134248061 isoform X1 n=1 Tax=Saccostrea cuccullata TaxID=36930 RepID=UPI002ED2DEBD